MEATETLIEPKLGDPSSHWPPVAHIARKKHGTVKEGDLALCGEKLMGINLDDAEHVCVKCIEVARRELRR